MSSFSLIDDRDPSVTYVGTWVIGGTIHEYDDTVTSSLNVGDHFSVPFTGTGVAVYGTYDSSSGGVKTLYAIDGDAGITVVSSASPNGLDDYQQLFWQSETLSSGSHTLVVTMEALNDNQGAGEGTIWFDYFNVTLAASSAAPPPPPSSTGGSSTTGSSAQPSSTGILSSNTNTQTSGNPSSPTSAPSSSTGSNTAVLPAKKSSNSALIGGVVAAIIVVTIILCVLFFQRKRRQQNYAASAGMPPSDGNVAPSHPGPFYPTQAGAAPLPMSGFPGSPPMQAVPYSHPLAAPLPAMYGPGQSGFDPRATYAAPTSAAPYAHPSQAYYTTAAAYAPSNQLAFDPYTPTGPGMQYHDRDPSPAMSSSQWKPSSSTAESSVYPASLVSDLKRRQQEVVASYEHGVAPNSASPRPGPAELPPPVYTPQ
ncbi:hypothetical protein B0H11DRAFT_1828619 [Mycena galericulata]|nr:hypothetical protein B0H11DRAFT_1828619 [Mycena galericulata]